MRENNPRRLHTYYRIVSKITGLILVSYSIALTSWVQAETGQPEIRDSILRAVLWMRTSGEYEALCRQTYRTALEYVHTRLRKRSGRKPPAVILDLDETVLDNSAYSAHLIQAGLKHSERRWQSWNRNNWENTGLVPGAREFIKQAEEEGIDVVFISNRSKQIRDVTVKILVNLDLAEEDDLTNVNKPKLLLKDQTSSKESRRHTVMAKYDVVAFIGDNLGDFSDDFRSPKVNSIAERRQKVREHADRWGAKWFVLPNPIYGHWTMFIDWNNPEAYFGSIDR